MLLTGFLQLMHRLPAHLFVLFLIFTTPILRAQDIDSFPVMLNEDEFLKARYWHQAWTDPNRTAYIRDLEAKQWIIIDTVVVFDPETYAETIQVYSLDLSPQKDTSGEWIYKMIDVMPGYPGGEQAMLNYISDNIRYPEERALGTVYVRIVIDQRGNLAQFEPLGDGPEDYKNEAKRVVRRMPKWKPGVFKGRAVGCEMVIPVQF